MPARTYDAIETELLDAKSAEPALAGYTNPSQTARWRKLLDLFAFSLFIHEQQVQGTLDEVAATAAANRAGTPRWYAERALEFQDGDDFDEVLLQYDALDASKRIVTKAAASTTAPGTLTLKVAKMDNNAPAPLDAGEQSRLTDYLAALNFGGTLIELISEDGDAVTINATIYYDGELVAADVQGLVVEAITAYFDTLPFDGRYRELALVNAIQAVPGVVDLTIDSTSFSGYDGSTASSPRVRSLAAGYVQTPTINLTMQVAI